MDFQWKKGYKLHEYRRALIHCAYKKKDMKRTIDNLKLGAGYNCSEEEIQEYLKLYPITREEIRWAKEQEADLIRLIKEF